jgi:hypothetical protein
MGLYCTFLLPEEAKKSMKIWIGILLAAVMLISCGCFDMPSLHPLFSEQTAIAEPGLVGAWQTKDGKEQMFVRLNGDREYRLTYVDDQGEASVWVLRVIKLGEIPVADMMTAKNDTITIPAHHFLAMSLSSGTLKAWFLDSSLLREKAVKENLAYIRGKKDEVVLTAPTESIAAFLKKSLADEMKKNADIEFLPLK